jgi:Neuraminidase (sialidase)
MENMMGKMKQLAMMIEEGQSYDDAVDEIMNEAHYWSLVSNVAQLIVDTKSTRILTDVEHAVHKLYLNGNYSKQKGNTK